MKLATLPIFSISWRGNGNNGNNTNMAPKQNKWSLAEIINGISGFLDLQIAHKVLSILL